MITTGSSAPCGQCGSCSCGHVLWVMWVNVFGSVWVIRSCVLGRAVVGYMVACEPEGDAPPPSPTTSASTTGPLRAAHVGMQVGIFGVAQ